MPKLTGRRPTLTGARLRAVGGSILDGLGTLAEALNDGPKLERIHEIDAEVRELLQERDHLIATMNNPNGLEVSEDYDPRWTPKTKPVSFTSDGGRLVDCPGYEWLSDQHHAHPACPYKDGRHSAHQFTAHD